jgi:hypothetical protein
LRLPPASKRLLVYLPLVAAAVFAGWRSWHAGMLSGHSAAMDFARMVVLDDAVRSGDWWPRFNEAFYLGYGSLLFHFYAPLGYYVAEVFRLCGATISASLKIASALGLLLSGVFMFWLVRDLFDEWAGVAAGVLYVVAPYHLLDLYVRHAFGEAFAFAWLPLAFWGVHGAVARRSAARGAAGAVGMAALLLSHNITAMLAAPALLAWWLYLGGRERRTGWRGPLLGALAGVFGLALAAFFWLPALAETDLVWSKRSLTQGFFDYRQHFVYAAQWFRTMWSFGSSKAGPGDGMSFQLGVVHWSLLAGLPFVWWRMKPWRGWLTFFAGFFAAALWLTHESSSAVWRLVPVLSFAQFPWRFMLFTTFAASALGGAFVAFVARLQPRALALSIAVLLVAAAFGFYYRFTEPHYLTYNADGRPRHKGWNWREYHAQVKSGRVDSLDNQETIDYVRARFNRGTAEDDYLPIQVKRRPDQPPAYDVESPAGHVGYLVHDRPCRHEAFVTMRQDGEVVLQRFWYPGWRAWIDGRERRTKAHGRVGLVAVDVPAGEHDVRFTFALTRLRVASSVLSVIALLSGVGLLLWQSRRRPAAPVSPD